MITVPNAFPTLTAPYRIAFIGEAPGRDEVLHGKPFVGESGRLFNGLLAKANIIREACFVGNVCQHRPEDNVISKFDWFGPEIQDSIQQLCADLKRFDPNLIVCLGATALELFRQGNIGCSKKKDGTFVYGQSIDSWRGSLFLSTSINEPLGGEWLSGGHKCLAAHHPAFCLRAYENTQLLACDINKALREGKSKELVLPSRDLQHFPTFEQACERLSTNVAVSLDIEGYWTGMSCISAATAPNDSITIPFFRKDGSSYWTEDEEIIITRKLALLLSNPTIPKVWQNGLYDRWVLQYGFSMPVLGSTDDTMLKWWEKWCELPKGLDTQCSILTDEPYYKSDRKTQDDRTFYLYCAKDSAVTMEINNRLDKLLTDPASVAHYRFNHDLLNLFLYIELRGIAYNTALAKQRHKEIKAHIWGLQADLDAEAGCGLPHTLTPKECERIVRVTLFQKKDSSKPYAAHKDIVDYALLVAAKPVKSPADWGALNSMLELDMNTDSKVFKDYLYNVLKLPKQYNKTSGALTTDNLTLQRLAAKHPCRSLTLAIELGTLKTRASMLEIHADPDGRIRCGYNVVGTVTGRTTSYTSPTGSGYALQTIPDDDTTKLPDHPLRRGMRDLIVADPGHYMFQCDLKGSDGWTIGAHLNRLGDSTMLDDLRFGIKPAQRIAYMLRHGNNSLNGKDRNEIKERLKEVKKEDWDYFACKVGIWGICYLMGPDLLSDQIFEESDGKISLSRSQVADFHRSVFDGYKVKLWHDWMSRQLAKSPTLTSASGNTRRFFGRPKEILGAALSTEPQANTTYATNLAAHRLWHDPENRTSRLVDNAKGDLVRVPFWIEPLHQIHDALMGQFPVEKAEWAVVRIREYFDNVLTIAGQRITIPFEGNYGTSWGNLKVGTI